MTIKIVNSLDETVWRNFVNQQAQGNIFHTPEMFQVFTKAKGYRPSLRAAVNENGQVLALFTPVQVSLKGGFLRRMTTRSIAFGGVLCAPDEKGREALANLLEHYRKEIAGETLFTEIRNLSDQSSIQSILGQQRFSYEDHLDYLIDLTCTPEELLMRIGARTRKHIRHELKRGDLSVEQVSDRDHIQTCYDLIKKSYLNAQVPVADLSLFEAAFEVLSPLNMVKFWLVHCEGNSIGASVELIFKDVIFGWYGGVDRDYSRHTPTEFLTWYILNWGVENGFRVYDFGGAGTPDEEYGVRDFKAKFGGQLVCYGRNTYVRIPFLLRLFKMGYNVFRRVIPI